MLASPSIEVLLLLPAVDVSQINSDDVVDDDMDSLVLVAVTL
jgi:hypothetical protein